MTDEVIKMIEDGLADMNDYPIEVAATEPDKKMDKEVLEVLNLWKGLSKVQRKTFSCLCEELDIVSELIETNTSALSDRFNSIVAATNQQTEYIDGIVETAKMMTDDDNEKSLPNLVKYLDETLDSGIGKIVRLSKESIQMVYDLEEVTKRVQETEKLVQKVEEINSKSNLLALNAKIEAASAGDAGRGFSVVSDEMRELSQLINDVARNIKTKIGEVSTGINTSFKSLQGIANIDMSENITAKDNIDGMMGDLMAYNADFNQKLLESSQMSEKISRDISGLITGFQFQDRATQYLATIKKTLHSLDDFQSELENNEAVNSLEYDHADDEKFKVWIEKIIESFPLQEVKERFVKSLNDEDSVHYLEPQVEVTRNEAEEEDGVELF